MRASTTSWMIAGVDNGGRIRIVVEMATERDPIEGTVATHSTALRAFTGWMDLVALLDEARERASGAGVAAPQPRGERTVARDGRTGG